MFNERVSLGMPSLAGYELFSALGKAKELGFQSVMSLPGGPNTRHSLGEFPTFGFYEESLQYREQLKNILKSFKFISIHQAWDMDWKRWFDCADYFGAKIVTAHLPNLGTVLQPDDRRQKQITYFREMGDYARGEGIRIGVENSGGGYDEYVGLIKSIDHPAVGATIDVGHCAYFTEVSSIADLGKRSKTVNQVLCRLVEDLGEKLYHFHVHNVRKDDWRDHRSVAEGVIDFRHLFAVLKNVGYSGLFDIELEETKMEEKSSESGKYLSQLIMQLETP